MLVRTIKYRVTTVENGIEVTNVYTDFVEEFADMVAKNNATEEAKIEILKVEYADLSFEDFEKIDMIDELTIKNQELVDENEELKSRVEELESKLDNIKDYVCDAITYLENSREWLDEIDYTSNY